MESHDSRAPGPDESELDSEAELMRSMGLPLQFGGMSVHKNFEVSISLLLLFMFLSFLHKISHGIFFIPSLMHSQIRAPLFKCTYIFIN